MMFSTSCKKPVAGFTASKTTAQVGEPITFADSETDRKNTTIIYDFGDGTKSSGASDISIGGSAASNLDMNQNATHVYTMPGTYTVSQQIVVNKNPEKGKSKQVVATTKVTIVGATAAFTVSSNAPSLDETVKFTNTSTDWDMGAKPTFKWWSVNKNTNVTTDLGTNKDAWFTWSTPGTHVVYLTVGYVNNPYSSTPDYAYTSTAVSSDIVVGGEVTVGGQNLSVSEMQEKIAGKWNVATTTAFSGYTSAATTNPFCPGTSNPNFEKAFSSITLDNNGMAVAAVLAYPSTKVGNITDGRNDNGSYMSLTVVNSSLVSINGAINGQTGGPEVGLYSTTVSGSSMTLTRVYNDKIQLCGTTGTTPTTATYTITLTR